jgi:hypothetical protein
LARGTDNTVSLKAKYKAALETAAIQAQRIRDLEKDQAQTTNTPATPQRNKKTTERITPEEKAEDGFSEVEEDDFEDANSNLQFNAEEEEVEQNSMYSVVTRKA